MSRFLVTGGAGFIGSHIVEYLVRHKNYVRVLDNFSSGKRDNLKQVTKHIELVQGDIRAQKTCLKATSGIDFVLHQAALRSVPKSMSAPRDYNEVNINGTLNMLEASLKNKVMGFVLASSSSVYGDVDTFPQREDFRPTPISPYALTKLAGEYYCRIFRLHYGLNTVALRYFNVFGERQGLDDEYAVVIPKFITCMLCGKQPPIYGTGKQSRDFTYVDNVVYANILAARSCVKKTKYKNSKVDRFVFNIASGKDYTILELVKLLNIILGKSLLPVMLPARKSDVFRTFADLSIARQCLGFTPKVDFITGLNYTVEYFKGATQ